jgi:hypothetical protein
MATITHFRWYETEYEDPRDSREAIVRNKIKLKTSERVTWTALRLMSPVPGWGDEHPKEKGFYLDFVRPVHKSKHIWELEAEYSPIKAGQIDPSPLARPVVITYTSSLIEMPTQRDNKGRPMVNRAGELLQGIMLQRPILEYKFVKNLPSDPKWITTHLGAVNSDTIRLRGLNWAPRTLLLSAVEGGEFVTENRQSYTATTGTILADPLTWTQEFFNMGTVQLEQQPRMIKGKEKLVWVQVPIMEGDPKEHISDPVPLDEDGVMISDAWEPSRTEPLKKQKLITLKFDVQPEKPFSELPLK